jgi:dihydroorotase
MLEKLPSTSETSLEESTFRNHPRAIKVVRGRDLRGQPLGFSIRPEGVFEETTEGHPLELTFKEWAEIEGDPHGLRIPLKDVQNFSDLPLGAWVDAQGATLVPAAIDAHVHSRDPGLTHKEDWQTLARGAAKGGVVAVCDMPNTIPPTLSRKAVLEKAKVASQSGMDFRLLIGVSAHSLKDVGPLLSDPDLPICALKVFYGKTTGELMYDDLETLARYLPEDGRKLVVFHSEDQCQVDCNEQHFRDQLSRTDPGGFAVHSQIRSSAAAHASTRTILEWGLKTYQRPIHIAHCSTPVEVELIQEYKAKGLRCTSEIAPHHLIFTTDDYSKLGSYGKMNPPLRSPEEVAALRKLVRAGAIEMFATDHAPHTRAEKDATVSRAPSGVPGVEYFWPLVLECLRRSGLNVGELNAQDQNLILRMACANPAQLFGISNRGGIQKGKQADFVALGESEVVVSNQEVVSKCGWSPYDGMQLPRGVRGTWWNGKKVW